MRDVPRSEGYVSQIHSRRHIEVRALDEGYLEEVPVQEGQRVRAGQLLFRIFPVLYRARLDAHRAEFNHAEIELQNARMLAEQQVISAQELALVTADRDRIRAELDLARAEFGFTSIVAPFDGLIDRQYIQQGSLVGQGDVLTTISDNEVMWVYFNVPEADYLRYRSDPASRDPERPQLLRFPGANIQLRLANAELFEHEAGDTVTVESNFDNTTGNVQFRVDFPNPEGLLLHGQTGTVLINDTLHDVLVIPQRAVFDILDHPMLNHRCRVDEGVLGDIAADRLRDRERPRGRRSVRAGRSSAGARRRAPDHRVCLSRGVAQQPSASRRVARR